jgi:hypothetical protein
MRYRKLDENSDMQFGNGSADFWHDVPDAVGQAVKTRLLLFRGEWFLDTSEGTPWGGFPFNEAVVRQGQILAEHTRLTRDMAIKERVIRTQGVVGIVDYGSSFDPDTRGFSVGMIIDTVYGGQITLTIVPQVEPAATAAAVSIQYEVMQPTRRPPPPLLARGDRWRSR